MFFQNVLHPCALNESSLSIGRIKMALGVNLRIYGHFEIVYKCKRWSNRLAHKQEMFLVRSSISNFTKTCSLQTCMFMLGIKR